MQTDAQAAIDFLIDSSGEAIEQIDAQIVELEGKLSRLRRARRVLAQTNGEHKAAKRTKARKAVDEKSQHKIDYWSDIEQKVYDLVSVSGESMTCSEVSEQLGMSYVKIGKAIAQSQRLGKSGSYITVLS